MVGVEKPNFTVIKNGRVRNNSPGQDLLVIKGNEVFPREQVSEKIQWIFITKYAL